MQPFLYKNVFQDQISTPTRLAPRTRPAFRRLQYGNFVRAQGDPVIVEYLDPLIVSRNKG